MKRILLPVFAFLFTMLIVACAPTCTANQLVKPTNLTPWDTTVTSTNPALAWQFTPDCEVENFHFEVSTDPLMNHPNLTGDTHNHYLGFATPIEYLDEDCTAYYWRVTAEADGASSPSNVALLYGFHRQLPRVA